MKYFFLIFVMTIGLSVAVAQQNGSLVLNARLGYTFQDKMDGSYGRAIIKDAVQYGGAIEYYIHPYRSIELSYQRMDTDIPFWTYGSSSQYNERKEGAAVSYILLGGNNYIPTGSDMVFPYGGFGLGLGIATAKDYSETFTKFGWELKLGVKLKFSELVSLKLQGYVESIVQGMGGGLYLGTGGAGAGVSTYSSIYQFGLGGALCFRLK